MVTAPDLTILREWLVQNGGSINPNVAFEWNEESGVHCTAVSPLDSEARICTIPHSLALSSLNALVDDDFTVFRRRGLAPEAIGYFYLMYQYINRKTSFWKPYLNTLPGPDMEHHTPFCFDDQDRAWIEDTDVLHTTKARQEIHKAHYQQGVDMLKRVNVDTGPYTWTLFKWAITMYTSRSFSSRALRPLDSKYWAAYKTGPQGQRQTALVDMSRISAEDQDFPVLFPVIDIPNHSNDARVDWAFDPGRFSITLRDGLPASSEVFNNYGPKSNDELLLGYGFCTANNPNDKVLLTLKPPADDLQNNLRKFQPGYFTLYGQWNSEKTTFGVKLVSWNDTMAQEPVKLFEMLPEPLLELLMYMLRHERGVPFQFIEKPLQYLTEDDIGRSYLPHVTRMIVQSLAPKLAKLQNSTPSKPPSNKSQEQAAIYRFGQIQILQSAIDSLRNFLRSFLPPAAGSGSRNAPVLVTVEGLLGISQQSTDGDNHTSEFLQGIAASAGTTDIEQLRQAGWEDDVLVLLLCSLYLRDSISSPDYLSVSDAHEDFTEEEMGQAGSLMELVRAANEIRPGSVWEDKRWSERFIAGVGGRTLRFESFMMMIPGLQEARLVVYLHGM